jgi:hypothetical protein
LIEVTLVQPAGGEVRRVVSEASPASLAVVHIFFTVTVTNGITSSRKSHERRWTRSHGRAIDSLLNYGSGADETCNYLAHPKARAR